MRASQEDGDKMAEKIIKAMGKKDEDVHIPTVCYALGMVASLFLSRMPDSSFEAWVEALRDSRREYLREEPQTWRNLS